MATIVAENGAYISRRPQIGQFGDYSRRCGQGFTH